MPFQNCGCRVKRCPECGECPKHDCSHDGVSLSVKANRKCGRQPGKMISSSSKRKRRTLTYAEGNNGTPSRPKNISFKMTPCITVNDLNVALDLDGNYLHHFPSLDIRRTQDNAESIERYSSMVSFAQLCIRRICELIHPANPSELEAQVNKGERIKKKSESLIVDMAQAARNMKKRSIEQRITFAYLSKSFSRKEMSELVHPSGVEVSPRSFALMRQDLQCLLRRESLEVQKRTLCRYDKAVVTRAVKFILGPSNAQGI